MFEQVFGLGGLLAVAGWVLLAVAPLARGWAPRLRELAGFVFPAILAVAYLVLLASRWGTASGGFGSISEVRALFSDDAFLVAGWFHYLAFDLFVGGWIARRGHESGVHHLFLLPCFVLTFLFGPVGYLLFLLVKTAAAGRGAPASVSDRRAQL